MDEILQCLKCIERYRRDAEKTLHACQEELAQMKEAARPKYARRDGFPPHNLAVLWQALTPGEEYALGGYDHEDEVWFDKLGYYDDIDPLEVMWQYRPNLELD